MKIAIAIILSIVVVFIGIRIFSFISEGRTLSTNWKDIETRLAAVKANQADLEAQVTYLSNPANLEKELRAQFNYAKPGEKMIIIVPPPAASSSKL
jgi:cell division protein FtsB